MTIRTDIGPVLVTGATGYVGGLVAASLLAESDSPLVLLVRPGKDRADVLARLAREAAARGGCADPDAYSARVRLVELPDESGDRDIVAELAPLGLRQIVHAAGCLDYFAQGELDAVNVGLTRRLAACAGRLGQPRFVYVSTAYSSGYLDGPVPETPHGEPPGGDPTFYTLSKRRAERVVMEADVPWLVVRPSVLIGDSRDGRYSGKRYGLYQLWMGMERLLCDRRHDEMHIAAPRKPINLLHQNAFQDALMALIGHGLAGRCVNLVSANATSPLVRELWELWFAAVGWPDRVVWYEDVDAVPLAELHPRQRAFIMFAAVNMRIAAHGWRFETGVLDGLRRQGLDGFRDATLTGIARCQQRFLRNSAKMQAYLAQRETPALRAAG